MIGPSAVDASLLAAHELNVAGGVRGAYVDLVLVDGGRSPQEVAAEVDRLCAADAVDALVGFHTSDVHRAIEATVAGRTPYVFTPPHEGGRRASGVVCIGTDPAHQLRPGDRLADRAPLAAPLGADRQRLHLAAERAPQAATRLVDHAGGRVVLDRLVPLGAGRTRTWTGSSTTLRRARPDAVLLSLVGRDLAAFNSAPAAGRISTGASCGSPERWRRTACWRATATAPACSTRRCRRSCRSPTSGT